MSFGRNMARARRNAGLSQRELAKAVEASPAAINHWENDNRQPDVQMIKKLARCLNVTGDYLLGLDVTDGMSDDAVSFAMDYDSLDEHGRAIVEAVLQLEVKRMEDLNDKE